MWRATVAVPAHGTVVYANLRFVPKASVKPAPSARPTAGTPHSPTRPARAIAVPPTQAVITVPDAAPTSTEESTPTPTLDLAAMRMAAGEHERRRVRSGVELVQEEQRVRGRDDSNGARAIKKAGRADCTKAYSGGAAFAPLRLIPLIYDTLTDTGCKW